MAITLLIEGQELRQEQAEPFCMTDAEAARCRESSQAARERDRRLNREATPETVAFLPMQRDPLVMLERDGRLRAEHRQAGQEILRVYAAISAGIMAKTTAVYGERIPSGPATEDWPITLRNAYRRYDAWACWAGRQDLRRGAWGGRSRQTLNDMTLLIAVDGWHVEAVARELGMHRRTVVKRLVESLHWYADNAGWLQEVGDRKAKEIAA